jgi:type II secretory pathway pseudopilin PulG
MVFVLVSMPLLVILAVIIIMPLQRSQTQRAKIRERRSALRAEKDSLKCWYKTHVEFYLDTFSHINFENAEKEGRTGSSSVVIFTGSPGNFLSLPYNKFS